MAWLGERRNEEEEALPTSAKRGKRCGRLLA